MPEDVLEKISSILGRKVEPVQAAAPAQPSASVKPVNQPAQFESPAEKILGRSLQPVKLPDMAASRFGMYSKARGNGFDQKKAAGVAMSQAGVMGKSAEPTTWDNFKTSISKVPVNYGRTLGDVGGDLSRVSQRANNPFMMSDDQWEKQKQAHTEFFERHMGKGFLAGASQGALEFGEEMLSPVQVALAIGTFGESALARAAYMTGIKGAVPAARVVAKLIQTQFAAQMIEGTASGIEGTVKSAMNGDWESAGKMAVEALASGLMAKGIIHHEDAVGRVRQDLEKVAREKYGVADTGIFTNRFDTLDPYRQGEIIDETVKRSPEYQATLQQATSQDEQARERTKKQQTGRLKSYYGQAMAQAWNPNVAQRTIRNLHESRVRGDKMDMKKAIQAHYDQQQEISRQLVEEQRQQERQAARNQRGQKRQEAAEQRSDLSERAKGIAAVRQDLNTQREKGNEAPIEGALPQRHVEAVVDDNGQITYPADVWGETSHFGVAAGEGGHAIYRQTPRGVEWMDENGNFAAEPESLFHAKDPETADTMARVASLGAHADFAAEDENATEEQKHEADVLSGIRRDLVEGGLSARDAQRKAGIAEKVKLGDQFDAARDGKLNGPYHESSPSEFHEQLEAELRQDPEATDEDVQELLNHAGALAREQIESNLNHVYRPGDYIVSKRGVSWTLDSKGMLHPSDGGTPIPLQKKGVYSNQSLQLAASGRVGYGTRTRAQRRADNARRAEIQGGIRDRQADIDREMRLAYQNVGLAQEPFSGERSDEGEKHERRAKFMSRPPVAPGVAEERQKRRMEYKASNDPDSVINHLAKQYGVTPDEVMRIALSGREPQTTEAMIADLEVGDRISDPMRKDRPWTVEERGGKTWLRSGQASPLPLDRLNPSDRVRQIIERGDVTSDSHEWTQEEKQTAAFEKAYKVHQKFLVEGVRDRMEGKVKDPEPKTPEQAQAQSQAADRREAAAESVATEATIDALNPTTTDPEKAENDVKKAEEDVKVAEEAAAQAAESAAKAVPPDPFPQRAPASIGYTGSAGTIVQNNREFQFHYELLPVDGVQTSHAWNGVRMEVNSDFPEPLQPRTISDDEAKQNDQRATLDNYDFRQYGDKTINASMGPTIVDPGGRAVGGNTRMAILRRHLDYIETIRDPEEKAARLAGLKGAMRQLAQESGIAGYPDDERMYVVVRMLDKPIETVREASELGRLFNKSVSVQITKAAKGVSYSKSFTEPLLEEIGKRVESADGVIPAMNADPEFFRQLVIDKFGVTAEEYADWFDASDPAKGLVLHKNGQDQFVKALLGTVVKDTSILNRIEGKTAYRALERALQYVLKMRAFPQLDMTDKILEAIQASSDTQGTDVEKHSSKDPWRATFQPQQQQLAGLETDIPPEPDRVVETLWRALHASDAAVPRTFNDRLKAFIDNESSQESMFGPAEPETPVEAFNRAFRKELRETALARGDKKEELSEEEFNASLRNREFSDEERQEVEDLKTKAAAKPEPEPVQAPKGMPPPPKVETVATHETTPEEYAQYKKNLAARGITPETAGDKWGEHIAEEEAKLLKSGTTEAVEAAPKPGFAAPPKAVAKTAETQLAEAKKTQGYVTPNQLLDFLQHHPGTQEHAHELMRTAKMMAEYVFDDDRPDGVDRKDALAWILKERVAGIEHGQALTKRGEYSDPMVERGIGSSIMRLHQAADPTSFIHEFAHVIFPFLSNAHLKDIDTIGGMGHSVWDGKVGSLKGGTYAKVSEKLAYGLEKFLRDENPAGFTSEVKALLTKLKSVIRKVYLAFVNDPLSEYENTDRSRAMFAKMLHISEFDVADSWRQEKAKARKEEKSLPKPEDAPHPAVSLAKKLGAQGIQESMNGHVEDSAGERVDPLKPTVVLMYDSLENAVTNFARLSDEESKIPGVDLIKGEDGKFGLRFNIKSKLPSELNQMQFGDKSTLYQSLPERHPGLKLEDMESRLKAMPAHMMMQRKLLELQIKNLKNEIRSNHGIEEHKPESSPEIAKAALKEIKDAREQTANGNGKGNDGLSGLPQPPRVGGIPKPPKLGMSNDAATGGKRIGAVLKSVVRPPASLKEVTPVSLQPITKPRGEPVGTIKGDPFEEKAWREGLKRAGLPETLPAPTVALSRETAEKLKFPGQKQSVQAALSALEQGDGVVLGNATGSGKCLAKGTPVILFDGRIIPVESVRVGDELMGPDSTPRKVLSLAHGYDRMYRIIPTKGEPYAVNEPHILSLKMTGQGGNRKSEKGDVVNIPVAEYLKKNKNFKHCSKGYRVGVEFPYRPPSMDPYILGMWLGDGTSTKAGITTMDPEIRAFWTEHVESMRGWIYKNLSASNLCPTYMAVFNSQGGDQRNKRNRIVDDLQSLNVLGNKHIPHIYKANSERVRLELLAGLIDTDGSLGTGYYEIIQKRKGLAEDIVYVARSLGLAAYVAPCKKTCVNNGKVGTYYRVTISGDVAKIPCRIWRKRAAVRRQKKDVLVTGIKVEYAGIGEYFGFELDGDRLFLLGDFTVTHNTFLATGLIKEFQNRDPNARILYITKNAKLKAKSASVADGTFGFKIDTEKPKDVAVTGAYAASYMGMMQDAIYSQMKWDLVVADESGEARNWFKPENQQGKMLMKVIANTEKAVYMSATPFHSPSEYGYLEKLNLWPQGQFDKWIQGNFAHENVDGKIVARLDPGKQAKLRQQLIERGQFVSQAISYDGFNAHFGVVPVTDSMKRGLDRIREGFSRARAEFLKRGKKGLSEKVAAFEATYTKAFLERERLPQAIELAKKAREQGWQVVLFSEHSSDDLFRRERNEEEEASTYQQLDDAMGGQLSRIIPPFPNVYNRLREEFGADIGDYSGRGNTLAEREKAVNEFLAGQTPMLYTTYAAGGIGVDMHDADFPDLGIKGGDKPRISIFLGPPYSGVLLEQAMGRTWRFGVKSDTISVFLASDSEPDVRLMTTKVGPRMRALRAAVLGEQDSLAGAMSSYTDEEKVRARQDALAYAEGNEQRVTANDFNVRSKKRDVGIQDWSSIAFPSAETAKNKGMKYGEEVPGGDWSTLYQDKFKQWEEGPPSKEKIQAEAGANEVAQSASRNPDVPRQVLGMGATQAATVADKAPEGTDRKAAGRMMMQGQLNAEGFFQDPTTGEWTGPHALVKEMLGDDVSGIDERELKHYPRTTLGMNFEQRAIAAGRKIDAERQVRDVLNRIRGYFEKLGGVKGTLQSDLADIHRMTGLDLHDEKTMREVWDVKEGRKASADPKINQAAELLRVWTAHARSLMEKGLVPFTMDDGRTGTYADIQENPTYMPHITDWNLKLTDPVTGETKTLKEITDDRTLNESAKLRYLEAKRVELGESEQTARQWLEDLKRDRTDRLRGPRNGNVTMRRKMNHPFYRKDLLALMSYTDQVASAVSLEHNFGTDMGKLRKDVAAVPNNMLRTDILSGVGTIFEHPDWTTWVGQVVRHGQGLEALTKMTLSPISAMFHGIHATMGLGGRLAPLAKSALHFVAHPQEMMREKYYIGVVSSRLNPWLVEGGKRGLANRFFEWSGFNDIYKMTRAIVGDSARVWMEQNALADLRAGGGREIEARRLLKDSMLIGDYAIDQAIATGQWSQDNIETAQRAFTDLVAFSENPMQMPKMARLSMGDGLTNAEKNLHAAARGTYMLQSFSIKTYSLLKEKLFDEVVRNGNMKPLAPFVLLYPAAGFVLMGLKAGSKGGLHRVSEAATGKKHEHDAWDKFWDQFKDIAAHPWVGPLKLYIDSLCTAAAMERVKRWADTAMMLSMGEKRKAANMVGYMAEDELEQSIGGLFSDIFEAFSSQFHLAKDELQTKKDNKRWDIFWRDEAREFEQILPISRSSSFVDRMAHPPKQEKSHAARF